MNKNLGFEVILKVRCDFMIDQETLKDCFGDDLALCLDSITDGESVLSFSESAEEILHVNSYEMEEGLC